MRSLVVYLNELSCPPDQESPDALALWAERARELIEALFSLRDLRPEFQLRIKTGHWHRLVGNRPMSSWCAQWIGPDRYRRLIQKISACEADASVTGQVYFEGAEATGFTGAFALSTWAFSFPSPGSPWLMSHVTATEWYAHADEVLDRPCVIQHISRTAHTEYWTDAINDWGRSVAHTNVIHIAADYVLEMYPLDHGYPHVHLVDPQTHLTLAKYRIDKTERMEGRPSWDREIFPWIDRHREQLLASWNRCQRGEHPYLVGT